MISQIEDWKKDSVKILVSHLIYFMKNEPSKSVTVGSGQAGPGRAGSSF